MLVRGWSSRCSVDAPLLTIFSEWVWSLGGVLRFPVDWRTPGLVRTPFRLVSEQTLTLSWSAGLVVSLNVSVVFPEHTTGTLCSLSMLLGLVTFGEEGGGEEGLAWVLVVETPLPDDGGFGAELQLILVGAEREGQCVGVCIYMREII